MTKESAAWLVIRTCGALLFAYAAYVLLQAGALSVETWLLPASPDGSLAVAVERKTTELWVLAINGLVEGFVAGALSLYLLLRGKAVHRFLVRE